MFEMLFVIVVIGALYWFRKPIIEWFTGGFN